MSNKSHIFQVWERDNQDFIAEEPRNRMIATFDTKAEAELFVRKQHLEKNIYVDCDSIPDYTYTIKRIHRNKVM